MITFEDECAASKALMRWLRSQDLSYEQSILVLAQTMARLLACGSAGNGQLTALDMQLIDQTSTLTLAYARSFKAHDCD